MTIIAPAITYKFQAQTEAVASQVNQNFEDVISLFETDTYYWDGWLAPSGFSLVYNSANSLESSSDVDLTGILQEGDKITFEQSTNGEYFCYITKVDYDTTVSNRSYVEVYTYNQTDIVDEALLVDTLGFSRFASPANFPPRGDDGWVTEIDFGDKSKTGAGWSATSTTFNLPTGNYEIYVQGLLDVSRPITRSIGAFALSTDGTESNIISKSEFYLALFEGINIRNTLRVHFRYNFAQSTTLTIMLFGQDGDTEVNIFSFRRRFLSFSPAYS